MNLDIYYIVPIKLLPLFVALTEIGHVVMDAKVEVLAIPVKETIK